MTQAVPLPQIAGLQLKRGKDGRLRVYFTYHPAMIARIKTIPGWRWHPEEKCWSVPHTLQTLSCLQHLVAVPPRVSSPPLPPKKPPVQAQHPGPGRPALLAQVEQELQLRRYSPKTRKAYQGALRRFLSDLGKDPTQISAAEIRTYLLKLVEQEEVSASYQNQTISAIKFLFDRVLKRPHLLKDLPRPRRERLLPAVMSRNAAQDLLNAVDNLKHQTLLVLRCSAGLRVGEVVHLRVEDLDEARGMIRIRGGKGRKDRYTLFSTVAKAMVGAYCREYQPRRWLFPGA